MTIGELLAAFPKNSEVQINIITDSGSLTFIPNPAYFLEHRHWKTMQELEAIPVHTLNVCTEQMDGQLFLLLVINEEVHDEQTL